MAYTPPTASPRTNSNALTADQYPGEAIQYVFDFLPSINASDPNDTITSVAVTVPSGVTAGTATAYNVAPNRQVYVKLTLAAIGATVKVGQTFLVTCAATTADGQTIYRNLLITAISDAPSTNILPDTLYTRYPGDVKVIVFDYSDDLDDITDFITSVAITVPTTTPTGLSAGAATIHGTSAGQVWVPITVIASGGNAAVIGTTYEVTCKATTNAGQTLTQTCGITVKDPAS